MDRTRFEMLAEAYGGTIARWPEAERAAALVMQSHDPIWANELLSKAEGLDARLDVWRTPAVGHDLREAVIAAAAGALRRTSWVTWALGTGAGIALAGASAAGMVLGVALAETYSTSATDEPISSVMSSYESPVVIEPVETSA